MVIANKWLLAISLLAVVAIGAGVLLYRRKITLGGLLRFLAAAAVVASFGGIRLEVERSIPLAVYVLDVSESYAGARLSALEAIRTHAAGMGASSQAALVTFGTTAALDGPVAIGDFNTGVNPGEGLVRSATSIEAGLMAASALGGRAERVYLFSDGRANRGRAQEGALLCSQGSLKVFPVILNMPTPPDAWVQRLEAPTSVSSGEPVRILVHVGANRPGRVRVTLSVGETRHVKEVESLGRGGAARVAFEMQFEEPGIKPLRAQVSAPGFSDSYPANNSARGALRVLGPLKVLVCSGRVSSAAVRVLKKQFSVGAARPEDMPETLGRMQNTAAVVLDNVSAHDLSEEQMDVLRRYVRDLGGGLIVLGGPGSFGPGGYIGSPLEKALPVWCNPEKRKKASLVFLLDSSGTMGQEISFLGRRMMKFRAALTAILPVYRELKEGDEVAVVTFDTRAQVNLQLSRDDDGEKLKSTFKKLAGKEPGGKTNIYTALRKALELLGGKSPQERKERILHIILLSDGRQTIEDSMDMDKFKEAGVSVSAVATGADPDRARLKGLAGATGGEYYEVAKFDSRLQEIFVDDIRRNLSELKRIGEVKVKKTGHAEFLRAIESFPVLAGIALTTPKDGAHAVAASDKGEPVLAWWRLGLGKAVAFTGGLDVEWGRAWLEWDSLGKLLSQAVRWSGTERKNPDFRLSAWADGLTVKANVLARSGEAFADGLKLKAVFSCPEAQKVDLGQVGPGEYEARAQGRPDSLCVVTAYRQGGEVLTSTEVWVAGSLESGPQGPDVDALSKLASLTGGEVLSEEQFLANSPEGRGGRGYDLWWVLLVLAGCFFLADIALASLLSARRLK